MAARRKAKQAERRQYTDAFKRQRVKEMLGGATALEFARRHGIPSRSVLDFWKRDTRYQPVASGGQDLDELPTVSTMGITKSLEASIKGVSITETIVRIPAGLARPVTITIREEA